jgi:hypothetical protein
LPWNFSGISLEFSVALRSPLRYPGAMGKIIRRTITITMTETWTITWATDGDPACHSSPVVHNNPKEELNENLQASLSETDPGQPGVDQPAASPTLDPQADDTSTRRKVSGRRTCRHKADSTQPKD